MKFKIRKSIAKISLVLFSLSFLIGLFFFIKFIVAPPPLLDQVQWENITISFNQTISGLTEQTFIFYIKQNYSTTGVKINLAHIVNETNFPIVDLRNIEFFIKENITYDVSEIINYTNITYFYNITNKQTGENETVEGWYLDPIYGTITKWKWDWEEAKDFYFTKDLPNKRAQSVATRITIPDIYEEDEYGNVGTKWFKLIIKTPITATGSGWGSSGAFTLSLSDLDETKEFHPWWNANYPYRYKIISNTTAIQPISVNDSGLIKETPIWARIGNDSYVYFTGSGMTGDIAIANETDQKFWLNETSGEGNFPISVWKEGFDSSLVILGKTYATRINDSSIYAHIVSQHGVISEVDGRFGKGLRFESANSEWGSVGTHSSLRFNKSFTLSYWVNFVTFPPEYSVISNYGEGTALNNVMWEEWPADKYQWVIRDTGGAVLYCEASFVRTTGRWYHVAVTQADNTLRVYINGTEGCTATSTVSAITNTANWTIGRLSGTYGRYLDGAVDRVVIIPNETKSANWIANEFYNGIANLTRLGSEESYLPPTYSDITTKYPSGVSYDSEITHGFQTRWDDDNDVNGYNFSYIFHNFTVPEGANYTTLRSGNISYYNITSIGVGTYVFRFLANDTNNLWNNSMPNQTYIITKATPTLNLLLDGVASDKTVTYPTSTNATGFETNSGDDDLTYSLYRNISTTSFLIGSGSNVQNVLTLGAGTYYYVYNTTGGANYTSGSLTRTLTVSKGVLLLSITGDQTVTYPIETTVTGTQTSTGDDDVTYELWREAIRVAYGVNANQQEIITLGAGSYSYRFNATTGANYTANSTGVTSTVTVNQNTSTINYMNLTIDGTEANRAVIYPMTTNATGWYNTVVFSGETITFTLYRNTTTIGTTNPISDNLILGSGDYNYTYYTGGNVNYSSATKQYNLTVSKGGTSINLYFNGTLNTNLNTPNNTIRNITAAVNVTGLTVNLNGNYTYPFIPSSGTTKVENITTIWNITDQIFNITGYFIENENYTSSFRTQYIYLDVSPPQFANKTCSYECSVIYAGAGQLHQFNITVTDGLLEVDEVIIEMDGLNSTITTKDGNIYYITYVGLGVATHTYRYFANDSVDNWNISETYSYEVIAEVGGGGGGGGGWQTWAYIIGDGYCQEALGEPSDSPDCVVAMFEIHPMLVSIVTQQGKSVDITYSIKNKGIKDLEIATRFVGDYASFNPKLIPETVIIPVGKTAKATLSLFVPPEHLDGSYEFSVIFFDRTTKAERIGEVKLRVSKRLGAVKEFFSVVERKLKWEFAIKQECSPSITEKGLCLEGRTPFTIPFFGLMASTGVFLSTYNLTKYMKELRKRGLVRLFLAFLFTFIFIAVVIP